MKIELAVALWAVALPGAAVAEDLLKVYDDALQSDPQMREASATRMATLEAKPQARALLLPQIAGAASVEKDRTNEDQSAPQLFTDPLNPNRLILVQEDVSGVVRPVTSQWSVTLRQNVFNWQNWENLKRADHTVAQAEADYRAAQEDLVQRVCQRYFDVLRARDALEAQQAAHEAITNQLEQANKRFEVGLIAVTDVEEAKAANDQAAAAVIAAKRTLATNVELLREITGAHYELLSRPGPNIPLKSPDPASEDRWVEVSMEQNLSLVSSRLAAEIARDAIRVAKGGHLPTLDLVAGHTHYRQTSTEIFPEVPSVDFPGAVGPTLNETNSNSIGLQLNVPIFSGGLTQSQVHQSQYQWIAAKERVARTSRDTERAARDAFLSVNSDISHVQALRQGLESSKTALKATEAGYEVGTRTAVDVLNARRTLVQAQTDYSGSRYDYILDIVNLKLASGSLDRATLAEINQWLDETVPTSAAPSHTPSTATQP
ncbi:MAG TPA: TolC family outer membrane protein [Steroidobacteraceae bacterium]|nr:TolC family outer membrane protein [Steroidobacteraceae bacterium]